MSHRETIRKVWAGAFVAAAFVACRGPEEIPPGEARSLLNLIQGLESRQAGVLAEIEYQEGAWDGVLCGREGCQRFWLDAVTGEETLRGKVKTNTDLPPSDVLSLPAAVSKLESMGLGVLTEIEFDDGEREVDFVRDGRKVEHRMDPRSGAIRPS